MNNWEFGTHTTQVIEGVDYSKAVVIEVQGNSMAPKYTSGTRVLARPVSDGNWEHAVGVYAVALKNGMFIIKRIIQNNNKQLVLKSDNTGELLTVSIADINCMWKIAGILFQSTEE
jgi:phage repressor protein C with HTH and peptisase S24 domain